MGRSLTVKLFAGFALLILLAAASQPAVRAENRSNNSNAARQAVTWSSNSRVVFQVGTAAGIAPKPVAFTANRALTGVQLRVSPGLARYVTVSSNPANLSSLAAGAVVNVTLSLRPGVPLTQSQAGVIQVREVRAGAPNGGRNLGQPLNVKVQVPGADDDDDNGVGQSSGGNRGQGQGQNRNKNKGNDD